MNYWTKIILSTVSAVLLIQFPAASFEKDRGTIPDYFPPLKLEEGEDQRNNPDDLLTDISEIASTLCRSMEYPDPLTGGIADGLLVTSFVELDDLYRTSSFGRYLAEQLMIEFQQRHYTVVDIRKSRNIMIQKRKGEFGISRDPSEIQGQVSADGMLSGTYLVRDNHILINARILDNKTGKILAGATKRISLNPGIQKMLEGRSTPEIDQRAVMYMKELGGES